MPPPAHAAQLLARQRRHVAALERDAAADDPAAAGEMPHDREGDGRLAAAGFADQPEAPPASSRSDAPTTAGTSPRRVR
jgi:hypothetical protein